MKAVPALIAILVGAPALAQQASLDLQERCAKRAESEFHKMSFQKSPEAPTFISHYNVKLNRCLIETFEYDVPWGVEFSNDKFVTDAYEGKLFASYVWRTRTGKKYWEVPPTTCDVTLPSGEETFCKSEEEFDNLVKAYME